MQSRGVETACAIVFNKKINLASGWGVYSGNDNLPYVKEKTGNTEDKKTKLFNIMSSESIYKVQSLHGARLIKLDFEKQKYYWEAANYIIDPTVVPEDQYSHPNDKYKASPLGTYPWHNKRWTPSQTMSLKEKFEIGSLTDFVKKLLKWINEKLNKPVALEWGK